MFIIFTIFTIYVVTAAEAYGLFSRDVSRNAISFIPSSDGLRACKRVRGNLTNGRDPG
jgi:hypothetical protein